MFTLVQWKATTSATKNIPGDGRLDQTRKGIHVFCDTWPHKNRLHFCFHSPHSSRKRPTQIFSSHLGICTCTFTSSSNSVVHTCVLSQNQEKILEKCLFSHFDKGGPHCHFYYHCLVWYTPIAYRLADIKWREQWTATAKNHERNILTKAVPNMWITEYSIDYQIFEYAKFRKWQVIFSMKW